MQLGTNLNSLKLEQSLLKQLDQEDIDFAQKQYRQMYAQQMSKLSSKIQKIQRVKKHLQEIQNEQTIKIKDQKYNLSKRYQCIEKNKKENLNQKLNECKLNHQIWQIKIKKIKRKNKQEIKSKVQQIKKFKEQSQHFWKANTQKIARRSLDLNRIKQSHYFRKTRIQNNLQQGNTDESRIMLSVGSTNQKQQNKYERSGTKKSLQQTKGAKFSTESNKKLYCVNAHKRSNNGSDYSHKYSIQSLRQKNCQKQSRKFKTIGNVNLNFFSENLSKDTSNYQFKNEKDQKYISNFLSSKDPKYEMSKGRNQEISLTFQKTMRKLEKIKSLKQRNANKLKTNQTTLVSSKPRKAINAQEYRLLRVKSQVNKTKGRVVTQDGFKLRSQNQNYDKQVKTTLISQSRLNKQLRHKSLNIMDRNRFSVKSSKLKIQETDAKKMQQILKCHRNQWKKDNIVKAIKDKITKIKFDQIRNIRQRQADQFYH